MDEKMLTRAVRKAVALGVFPKVADAKTYLRNWSAMEEILEAALSVEQSVAAELLPPEFCEICGGTEYDCKCDEQSYPAIGRT